MFPEELYYNFIVRAFIENPQDGYKYGISAILNDDTRDHCIYIDRYLESDPSVKDHLVYAFPCPGVGEHILTARDSSKIHLWVNWSGVETISYSWSEIFLQFSDFCYSVNAGTFIPSNSVSAKNVTDEIEKTSNKETTGILSGETEKYPSSFTVKQNVENLAKKDSLLSQFITSNDDKIEKNTQELISQQEEINEIKGTLGMEKNNVLHLNLNEGEESYIISSFNQTKDIKVRFTAKRSVSFSGNSCLNLNDVSLIDKDSKLETSVHSVGDDICPGSYNNTYIGANHGDYDCLNVTSNNHGKTPSDIGSLWEDSLGNECVLVGVPDENHLWFFGQNTLTYPKFTFKTSVFTSGVTLTHKSGALNTGSILISEAEKKQWYCAIRLANLSVILDDNLISESGDYEFNKMEICEDYDVLNPASVIEQIKSGVGTFSETPNPQSFSTADKVVRHSIIYRFDSAYDWKIITNFIAYQDINIGYFGFTQQNVLSGSDIHMYIPKALPISNGQEVLDFRTIAPHNNVPQIMNITSEYWENPLLPPDRWLEFSENIGLHSGYLFDYGVGGDNRKDNINNAFFLYTSRKCYPHGIDTKISVNEGDSFSAVTWRKYIDRDSINTNGIISKNVFEYNDKVYIYGDFNQIGIYEIEIPNEYVGKKIDVFENSENVTLLNEISSKKILVKVSSSNPLYGYIVASIKK